MNEMNEKLNALQKATQNTIQNVTSTVNDTMKSYGDSASVSADASVDFLTSNNIVAKIAFILLVLVSFFIMLYLGTMFINYALSPSKNPYIIKGLLDGGTSMIVPQQPSDDNSVVLLRSNNRSKGAEFTWSTWLFITGIPTKDASGTYTEQHIFSKGFQDSGVTSNTNYNYGDSPGLYLNVIDSDGSSNSIVLTLKMRTYSATPTFETFNIDNIPVNKWLHIAIRMENTIIDIYVNGTLAQRIAFNTTFPKQSYGSVYIAQNGGFNGKISNLQYFSRALDIFEINSIIQYGPNLNPVGAYMNSVTNRKYFFADSWYNSRY